MGKIYKFLCKITENRLWHKFIYYNHKNSATGSNADTGIPGIYWHKMEILSLEEVKDPASTVFL